MSRMQRLRIYNVFLLSIASLSVCGCFTFYPEAYDASDFEEFHYRIEDDRSCMDWVPGTVCEATITWQTSGDYIVLLEFVVDDQSASTDSFQRTMSESEVESILAVFKRLRIHRSPWPFCLIQAFPGVPSLAGTGVIFDDAHFRWDDFELVVNNCYEARLHPSDAHSIRRFLESLVPDQTDEAAETADE